MTVNITGLPAGVASAKHGLHIHQNGITVVSTDVTTSISFNQNFIIKTLIFFWWFYLNFCLVCGSSGPHFNPHNMTHGDISAKVRHVGDYGNVLTDANGNIQVTFNDTISKLYGPDGIIGRSIVLHQLADDLGLGNSTLSLSTGNSGSRIACGVIGIAA